MNLLLLLNNVTSVGLIAVCWWMVHLMSARKARLMAALYAGAAVIAISAMFYRTFIGEPAWISVLGKLLYMTLFLMLGKQVLRQSKPKEE